VDSYRALAATVKEAAPLLRRTDAMIRDERLIGTVECWCPQSHWVEGRPEFYRARQAAGEQVGETFSQVKLEGRLGDYAGSKTYATISSEPLDKWKRTLRNPLRKRWARRYLQWIGSERLKIMGYNLETLLAELDAVPVSVQHLLSDAVRMSYGAVYAGRRRMWE
jgi:hypothetical protein